MSRAATSTGTRPRRPAPVRAAPPPTRWNAHRIGVTAFVVVLVGALAWLVWLSPVLGVRTVRVEGTSVLTDQQVRAAAAVPDGEPLARVDTDAVRSRVAALRPVASVQVDVSWPNTVVVTVVERTPVVTVRVDGSPWLADVDGVVYFPVSGLPGGKAPDTTLPLQISNPGPDNGAMTAAIAVLRSVPAALRSSLASISAPSANRITLRLADGRTVIWGGPTDAVAKGHLVMAALGQPGTVFDVSVPSKLVVS